MLRLRLRKVPRMHFQPQPLSDKGVDLFDKAETRRDVLSGVTQERNMRSKIR
jgi:hypothetical protein